MHTIDIGSHRLFARRHPRLVSFGVTPFGLNLHRLGGLSLTGLPRSGGSTICWGKMRERCERIDGEQDEPERPVQLVDVGEQTRVQRTHVLIFGRFMVRIGRDF